MAAKEYESGRRDGLSGICRQVFGPLGTYNTLQEIEQARYAYLLGYMAGKKEKLEKESQQQHLGHSVQTS
jgi:hypothetical protein